MSIDLDPSSREFFESMYRRNADPWNFANDTYELSRYDAFLSALTGRHFARAFEPGCSIGVFTAHLASLCDSLLATDLSEIAVSRARERCADYTNVRIEQGSVADADPGPLDLLVLSEIGYYFSAAALSKWASRLLSRLQPGGTLLAAHWLGFSPDHILSGDRVHDVLHALAKEHHCVLALSQRTDSFRLDKWTRT
jgi:protein-L-isoaspartate O-methyltransferase